MQKIILNDNLFEDIKHSETRMGQQSPEHQRLVHETDLQLEKARLKEAAA